MKAVIGWKTDDLRILSFNDNYAIRGNGEILSLRYDRILKHTRSTHGFMQVKIGKKCYMVHILLAQAFSTGPVSHVVIINGDKSDLRLDNLSWTEEDTEKNEENT